MKAHWLIFAAALAVAASAAHGATPSFRGIGFMPGGNYSRCLSVSADGSVVVGDATSSQGWQTFRWTETTGMVGVGDLPGGQYGSQGGAVSGDGLVVAGYSYTSYAREAFRWTEDTGIIPLGDLPGGDDHGFAQGVSEDGSVVVGMSHSAHNTPGTWEFEAFRWTPETGTVGLGDLPGGGFDSGAEAVSADGSVVAGFCTSALGREAFGWTSGAGMVGLGDLPGGEYDSWAFGVSPDGSVVVGFGSTAAGKEAFRWTAETGMVSLGALPGSRVYSIAYCASAGGAVVVGRGWGGNSAFIWDEANGIQALADVLREEYELELGGWQLTEAWGVSDNGTVIVGMGFNPDGQQEGWIAVIPEPATLALLAVGLGALVARKRRA